ncbi:uncharacterized protein LOC135119606 isoform X2 [Zophobas morio]|uniref:uncharacterized protein LOC135119606 isoform X2 n=1 Tax=Zophobas morio TaxID=2755281 RepID=UPI0030832774
MINYVDSLKSINFYKTLENKLLKLSTLGSFDPFTGSKDYMDIKHLEERISEGKKLWQQLCYCTDLLLTEEDFQTCEQDLVEQLIVGLGWRITGEYKGARTTNFLVTSPDPYGVKLVITSKLKENFSTPEIEIFDHFCSSHVERYFIHQRGAQGIGVLAFEVSDPETLDHIEDKYKTLHPQLWIGARIYSPKKEAIEKNPYFGTVMGSMTILEAYAYYKSDKMEADKGTVLRFVYANGDFHGFLVLPGLHSVTAEFDGTSLPSYSDHWVSNVINRESFITVLEDVLGFESKVEFNAGVITAGRAKIQSTVAGNSPSSLPSEADSALLLRDQHQVYMAINSAITDTGHVYKFLKEIGQGVQHIASRVCHLAKFVERVNNYRRITGRGFQFMSIPRSYYGRLEVSRDLLPLTNDLDLAQRVVYALQRAHLCSSGGIVELNLEPGFSRALETIPELVDCNLLIKIKEAVARSRYYNLYTLLRDCLTEREYLQIVRNQVLVDVQGNDALFQIFTCNILQRKTNDEAPFLEFIERRCAYKQTADAVLQPLKPGCGGFGIRNFLALFLSIEVSEALREEAAAEGTDPSRAERARVSATAGEGPGCSLSSWTSRVMPLRLFPTPSPLRGGPPLP